MQRVFPAITRETSLKFLEKQIHMKHYAKAFDLLLLLEVRGRRLVYRGFPYVRKEIGRTPGTAMAQF